MYSKLLRWNIWLEIKSIYWIPHFVFYFEDRPINYKVVIVYRNNEIKSLKCDPFSDLSGVLIQKRDAIIYYFFYFPLGYLILLKTQEIQFIKRH